MHKDPILTFDELQPRLASLPREQALALMIAFLNQPVPLASRDVLRAATDAIALSLSIHKEMASADARYHRGLASLELLSEGSCSAVPAGVDLGGAIADLSDAFAAWNASVREAVSAAEERRLQQKQRDKTRSAIAPGAPTGDDGMRADCGRAISAALALGRAYAMKYEPAESLRWQKRALRLCDNVTGDAAVPLRAMANEAIGLTLSGIGDSAAALTHLRRAVALADGMDDPAMAAAVHASLARAYQTIGDPGAALQYYARSLELYDKAIAQLEKRKDTGGVNAVRYRRIISAIGMAGAHKDRGEYDAALELALAALGACEELRTYQGNTEAMAVIGGLCGNIVRVRLIIGATYAAKEQYDAALEQYSLAYALVEGGHARGLLLAIMLEAGRVHRALGQISESIVTRHNAVELAAAIDDKGVQTRVLLDLAQCHADAGNYRDAYEHHKQYVKLREELMNERARVATEVARIQFDSEQKENEAGRLRIRNAELESERLANMIEMIGLGHDRDRSASSGASAAKQRGENSAVDRRWLYFESCLNDLYPGFLAALAREVPTLTRREIQICSLLRLGLDAEKILKTFNFVQRTLDTHRHHIRAKLGCAVGDDLLVCLMAFVHGSREAEPGQEE